MLRIDSSGRRLWLGVTGWKALLEIDKALSKFYEDRTDYTKKNTRITWSFTKRGFLRKKGLVRVSEWGEGYVEIWRTEDADVIGDLRRGLRLVLPYYYNEQLFIEGEAEIKPLNPFLQAKAKALIDKIEAEDSRIYKHAKEWQEILEA